MSTKFYSATHKNLPALNVGFHDTDMPVSFFQEVNATDPLTSGNWEINIHNYKGDILEKNINWTQVHMSLTLGEIINQF